MASELQLIVDIVTVLGAAAAGGFLASRLRQPVLLGYLLGGMVVGPAGLSLVGDEGAIKALAEVGVALLLFALGVEFSIKELNKVRNIALGGGSLQVLLTIFLGGGLAYLTGWVDTIPKAIFLGAVLSLSSTAVVLKILIERNEVQTAHGQAMLAILIVQDLGLGLMLAVLPALTQPPEALGGALLWALLKSVLFIAGAVVSGIWLIPPLMRQVARTGSQELFVLTVFALCLGVALVTSTIGLGIEMGAFVAGLMISEVEYADQALDRVLPMRDIFATVFFASIGSLIDPVFLWNNAPTLLGLVAVVMVGKALIVTPVVMVFGYPFKTALTVGLGLNQIGEFSFVLAGVAQGLGLFSPELYGLTVGTTAVTLVVTPFVLKSAPMIFTALESLPVIGKALRASEVPKVIAVEEGIRDHIVVAGYGRVGETLVRMLRSQGHTVLVVDNNEATTESLRKQQIPYLFGDSSSELVLEKAHLEQARAMAIALPDPMATRLTLKRVLSIAPELDVTVRAHANSEIDALYQLGAREVVQPEFESALAMGSHMLITLGGGVREVQQEVVACRETRYRSILPARPDFVVANELEAAVEGLEGNWFTVKPNSPLVGLTLAQADIRRLTGVSVMAIRTGSETNRYPGPQTVLKAGDRVLAVGNSEEDRAFEELLEGRAEASVGRPERWVEVPENSFLDGQTLADVDLRRRHGVLVQAVQRTGKMVRFPNADTVVQAGDRLMVCGSAEAIEQLRGLLEQVPTVSSQEE
ncbi:cation:proton antiporter [Gloeobacter morelensis]|uniref:Cation:proton antiporter n=1 Tax=Gloeobacter morelensis MG652769 TaxID=2781736 RepID=A0ABY3PQJ0_9CYAN|nr:cation:proton antiporter [Gloeobacter morelensis]UFP95919.1 cation:proton antiporter [Gloeobacter morelensis MG652769]